MSARKAWQKRYQLVVDKAGEPARIHDSHPWCLPEELTQMLKL